MRTWIVMFLVLLASGCNSLPVAPETASGVSIEKVDSHIAHIGPVDAGFEDSGLRVRGSVHLNFGYRRMIPGSVRIEALDVNGNVVISTTAALRRFSAHARSAEFSAVLSARKSGIVRVRVTHLLER